MSLSLNSVSLDVVFLVLSLDDGFWGSSREFFNMNGKGVMLIAVLCVHVYDLCYLGFLKISLGLFL